MIPIFILSCDRLNVLERSIRSYREYIKTPFEIVIIDFGTTFTPTIKYLKYLEQKKVKIYWEKKISHVGSLNNFGGIIKDYFKDHPVSNYIVTDPDIALDNVDGDILDVYTHLLDKLPKITAVGPMLRIDDIPDCYPPKERLITRSLELTYHSRKVWNIQYKNKIIKYILVKIDTTFGMRRADACWWRHMNGARVLSPYSAKHLDWYLDPENLSPDQIYYLKYGSKRISTWNRWKKAEMKGRVIGG